MRIVRRAVYPGSFDPVTYGHIDIIRRSTKLFDEVIVAVAHNEEKNPLLTIEERVRLLKQATRAIKRVQVDDFKGLSVNYVKRKKAQALVRGLRAVSEFEFEFQMALTNRQFDPSVETIFMMPAQQYSFVSSRLIKEAAALKGNISDFVPPFVEKTLKKRYQDLQ